MQFALTNTRAESVTYRVTAEGVSGDVDLGAYVIHFVPGPLDLDHSDVEVSSQQVTANGQDASVITAILRDRFDNGIGGIGVRIEADSTNTFIDAADQATDAQGKAVFIVRNNTVETVHYAVYVDDGSGERMFRMVAVQFVAGELDPASSEVKVSPSTAKANGREAATVTVVLRDAWQNPLEGRKVVLRHDSSTTVVETVYGVDWTNADGIVHFRVKNTKAETVTFTAVDHASHQPVGQPVSVTFDLVRPDASESSVTGSTASVYASGQHMAVITVVMKDEEGYPLANREVKLEPGGGHAVVRPLDETGDTDANGEVQFAVVNNHVETVVFTAVDVDSGDAMGSVTVTFTVGPVSAGHSHVSVSRARVTADGQDAAMITVTLMDAYGHVVPGVMVTLDADSDNAVIEVLDDSTPIAGNSGVTDADGVVAFRVTNTEAETVTFTVSADSQTLNLIQVQFVAAEEPEPSPAPAPPAPVTPSKPDVRHEEEPASEEKGKENEGRKPSRTDVLRGDLIDGEAWLASLEERLRETAGLDAAKAFSDVEGHWALGPIGLLFRLQVVSGYGDGRFRPDQPVTRAEFASMLTRLFTFRDPAAKPATFADLEGHWGREAIERLSALGIAYGYPDGTFRPNEPITREEMGVMLLRMLVASGLPQGEEREFSDIGKAGAYAREAIRTAAKAGIVNGYEDGTFRPKGQATRAETAAMLVNLLMLIPGVRELLESYQ